MSVHPSRLASPRTPVPPSSPRLKLELVRINLRACQVARIVGYNRAHLSVILNGHRPAMPALRRDLAALVGMPEADLFSDEGFVRG